MDMSSAASPLQPSASHPVLRNALARISNRNRKRLEIFVTSTKHSSRLISNRNKNILFRTKVHGRVPASLWGDLARPHSAFGSRRAIVASPGLAPPPTERPPSGHEAASPSAVAGQRSASTRQILHSQPGFSDRNKFTLFRAFNSPQPAISNRNFQQLEIAVTPTKQTSAPSSNRNFRGTNLHRICEQSLPTTATSNRQWKGIEIAVTPTKHSPNLSLINNKKELFRKIACRAGCLPTIKPALSMQPRRRTATHPTKSHPTNPATSNRQRKGLEIPVTRRKHSPRHKSNRNFRGT